MIESYRKIVVGKAALRRKLASQPIADKLRMLDSLRERQLAIQKARESLPVPGKASSTSR